MEELNMFTRDLALLMDDFWTPRWSVQRTAEKAESGGRRIEPTVVVAKEDDCTYVEMLVPGFRRSSGKPPHFNGEMKASLFHTIGNFSPAELGKYSLLI
jgi:hypothetical protein